MTSQFEHKVYGLPYRLLDLVEQYLDTKHVKYERHRNDLAKVAPVGQDFDPNGADELYLYNVNTRFWEVVLRVEILRLAEEHGQTLLLEEEGEGSQSLRSIAFEPNDPTYKNPLVWKGYDGKFPNLCKGTVVVQHRDTVYRLPRVLQSGGGIEGDNVYSGLWKLDLDALVALKFPKYLWGALLSKVNEHTCRGCCGGCT